MATKVTVIRYKLRSSSPVPKNIGPGCPTSPPDTYVLQSFGVDVSEVDSWDALVGLYGSEVMQGRQNYQDTDNFRASSYVRISYTGTNTRDTSNNQIFKGQEEHSSKWLDEEQAGLIWIQ